MTATDILERWREQARRYAAAGYALALVRGEI